MTENDDEVAKGLLSAHDLKARPFAPLQFIVEGLIPKGLTVLAGAPKVRKSWLALDIALSVARGVACLDERRNHCPKGAVLYLALEDSERRLKVRIEQMLGLEQPWPANLYLETSWPRADADGLPRLRAWIDATPDARLIVIDVFQKFRSVSGAQTGYQKDYADLTELLNLAREKDVGILLVHHLRKSGGGDPFERMTGSTGILGVPDTLLVLDKGRGGTCLRGQARDLEELAIELAFDDQAKRWRVAKPRPVIATHPERDRIVALLSCSASSLSPQDIAAATGQGNDSIRQLLKTMLDAGEIGKVGRGRYVCLRPTLEWPSAADHSNHNDHEAHEAWLAEDARRERAELDTASYDDSVSGDTAEVMKLLNEAVEKIDFRTGGSRGSAGV